MRVQALFVLFMSVAAEEPEAVIDCNAMSSEACAHMPHCFPHWDGYRLICRAAQQVNCSILKTEHDALALFASIGLVNNAIKRAFRELVVRLPDAAWPTEDMGRVKKSSSRAQDAAGQMVDLAQVGLREPFLYEGLTAVVVWDSCYLKESFWNAANPDFGRHGNFVKMSQTLQGRTLRSEQLNALPRTKPQQARGDDGDAQGTWAGLEEGVCEDFTPWLTEDLGFEPARVHRVSLFDRLASADLIRLVFEIQKSDEERPNTTRVQDVQREVRRVQEQIAQELHEPQSEAARLSALFGEADVVALNGGNPDFLKFVLMELVKPITEVWKHQVATGRTVFLGRSAGSSGCRMLEQRPLLTAACTAAPLHRLRDEHACLGPRMRAPRRAPSACAVVGGRDISLTKEPNPLLLEYLMPDTGALHQGLGLAGECTIRPHYEPSWDVAVALAARQLEVFRGTPSGVKVVRVPDDEALQCIGTACKMVGEQSQEAELPLSKKQMRRLMRGFQDKHAAVPLFSISRLGFSSWMKASGDATTSDNAESWATLT